MKKLLTISLVMVFMAVGAKAETQSGASIPDTEVGILSVMPLDGSWISLDQFMNEGDFFTGGPWEWDEPYLVRFTITDIWVVSDQFEVYDNGDLVATTPAVPDWDDLGLADSHTSPPYTGNPDTALADGRFSSAVLYFGPGAHSITIKDIHIPPTTAGGDPFPDGTVAFKAEPLVEFTKEIVYTVEAGDMDGVLETGEDWHWDLEVTMKNLTDETLTVTKLHDRLGGDIEWHGIGWYSGLIGDLDIDYKGKTDKVFINFYDGFSLAPGQEEWLFSMNISPDVNTGTGNGKKSGHQEYTSPGEHCLNSGATFEGYFGDEEEYVEASTEPVCVEVFEAD